MEERSEQLLLTFFRHGRTDYNLNHKIQGQTDVPLDDVGKKEARNLARRIQTEEVDGVFSSDLSRASETAKIATNDRNDIVFTSLLRERHFGINEERYFEEVVSEWFPNEKQNMARFRSKMWDKLAAQNPILKMETNLDMAARAEKALEFICLTLLNSPKYKPRPHWDPEASQNVLPSTVAPTLTCWIFSHGLMIRAMLSVMLYPRRSNTEQLSWFSCALGNTSISRLRCTLTYTYCSSTGSYSNIRLTDPHILLLNDTAHNEEWATFTSSNR